MWFSLSWYLEHWDSFQLLSEIWIWGSLRWLGRSCHLELSHCHVTWYRAPSFCALPKNCHTTTTGIQIHKETNTQTHPCHQIPCTFLALILKTTTQQKAQSQAQYKVLGRYRTGIFETLWVQERWTTMHCILPRNSGRKEKYSRNLQNTIIQTTNLCLIMYILFYTNLLYW